MGVWTLGRRFYKNPRFNRPCFLGGGTCVRGGRETLARGARICAWGLRDGDLFRGYAYMGRLAFSTWWGLTFLCPITGVNLITAISAPVVPPAMALGRIDLGF